MYPLNLALLYSLVGEDPIKDLSMTSHQVSPPIVQLPDIKHFNNTLRQQLAENLETELNLKQVMKLANNDKLVFSSLSDMLAQQAETIQEWYQSVPGYFLIAMTTATAFLIFAVIILGWKLYKTMLVVAVLSRQYGNANAQGESEYKNNA